MEKTKLEIWEKKLEIKKNTENLEKFVNLEKIRTLENNFEIWKKYEEFWNLKKKELKFENLEKYRNLKIGKEFGNNLKFEKNFTIWEIGSLKEIWKKFWNLGSIWKFGKNLEIREVSGNLEKIEILRNFGNLDKIWRKFGYSEKKLEI